MRRWTYGVWLKSGFKRRAINLVLSGELLSRLGVSLGVGDEPDRDVILGAWWQWSHGMRLVLRVFMKGSRTCVFCNSL